MKEYKNSNQMIDRLLSKGMTINNPDFTINRLDRYGYKKLIRNYREPFYNIESKRYFENVKFEDVYHLFKFDEDLKTLILKYILDFEVVYKNRLAEVLSKHSVSFEEYFDTIQNENALINIIEFSNFRRDFMIELKRNISKNSEYYTNINLLPPWTLVQYITFNLSSRIYKYLNREMQIEISRFFGVLPENFTRYLIVLNQVRNRCVHCDSLYNYDKYSKLKRKTHKVYFSGEDENVYYDNFYIILVIINELYKYDTLLIKEFNLELKECIDKLGTSIGYDKLIKVLKIMRIEKYFKEVQNEV